MGEGVWLSSNSRNMPVLSAHETKEALEDIKET